LSENRQGLNQFHKFRSEFATDETVNPVILSATGALADHFPRIYPYAPICPHMILGSRPKSITRSLRRIYALKDPISDEIRRRQLLYCSVMWITFAGFRIYPVMEREKYSALARDHPLLDPFSPVHHQ
jgi:hypothetical protein